MAGRRSLFAEDENPFARTRGGPPGDLDITPMIDVTFLLLIFFMVSSNMNPTPILDLPPADHTKGVDAGGSTVVSVLAPRGTESAPRVVLGDGDGPDATLDELKRFLEEEQRAGRTRVVVKAEGDAPHGLVNDVARAVKSVEGLDMFLGVGDKPQ